MRLLDSLPPSWETPLAGAHSGLGAADHYLTLCQTPARLDAESVYAYALMAVSFSRRVVPWAEYRLANDTTDSPLTGRSAVPQRLDESLLAPLRLDVQLRFDREQFVIAALDAPRVVMGISPHVLSILTLYDGKTSRQTAADVASICGDPSLAADVHALVRQINLAAPSFAASGFRRPLVDV
jgi:hypothetical protein